MFVEVVFSLEFIVFSSFRQVLRVESIHELIAIFVVLCVSVRFSYLVTKAVQLAEGAVVVVVEVAVSKRSSCISSRPNLNKKVVEW